MRLEQRLTPQLIQSMNILQKSVTDLEAHVNEALESNAALELAEPEQPGSLESGAAPTAPQDAPQQENEDSFSRLDRLSRDYDLGFDNRAPQFTGRVRESGEPDAKMGALANTADRGATLQEHLIEQLAFADLSPEHRRACEAVIDHVDPDGYLRARTDEIATGEQPPLDLPLVEDAVLHIQRLEPAGVGARDVIECLLLQLDRLPGDNGIERELIKNHLDAIGRNLLPSVAKATGFTVGEISAALDVMKQNLVLHPGMLVGGHDEPPIRPDAIVEYADTGGGLTVRLTRGNTPKLTINSEVADLVKAKTGGVDKETREFAKKQVESASALIDAVNFRRSRLLEVVRIVVERQRDFFDVGAEGLKALRMSDLADELQCDPSTISRTVAEKYLQTPRGIYPLRYFFTGGTQTDEGESVGWDQIKTQVKELVDREDPAKPLKDDQIADLLKERGIEISRRTVAKYRQQLDIPNARRRQKYS